VRWGVIGRNTICSFGLSDEGDIMELKVVVRKGETGQYVANVPALRGCWSQGQTRAEALENVKEAAELWLEVEQEKQLTDVVDAEVLAVCV
jgi:predicted RNase H-like HicB family nuclease